MKAVLPLIPNATPSASPEASAPRAVVGDGETFASVLERRSPAGQPRVEQGEAASAESGSADPEATGMPREEEEGEAAEVPMLPPLPTLVLPALPYHPVHESRILWTPLVDEALLLETEDGSADTDTDTDLSTTDLPAQSAATISAGQGQSLPILTAMFPVPMAQLQAQLRSWNEPATRETSGTAPAPESRIATLPLAAKLPPSIGVLPGSAVAVPGRMVAETAGTGPADAGRAVANVPIVAPAAPTLDREPGELSPTSSAAIEFIPEPAHGPTSPTVTPPREFADSTATPPRALSQRQDPVLPIPALGDTSNATPTTTPARVPIATRAVVETSLVESTAPLDGTSAAKRGEVMQAIAFQAPPKPRGAKSAGDPVAPLASVETTAPIGAGPSPELSAIRSVAPATIADDGTGRMPETPSTPMPASVGARPESGATHSRSGEDATAVESNGPKESASQPGADLRVEIEAGGSANFQTTRPQAERVTAEAIANEAPVARAEWVQIVERTADAAVRMRATGSERLEVAVQLENGDRLSIQLRLANGEVTPYFRTSSEGLRTALEQNWTQFSDRANDRGVRLTPPVFDVHQSSSDMTDLSQQRHGRDTAYTDAQAELFPNLPRRMRPPRVLASAPLTSSSATTVGVRTYA